MKTFFKSLSVISVVKVFKVILWIFCPVPVSAASASTIDTINTVIGLALIVMGLVIYSYLLFLLKPTEKEKKIGD
ncbi:hypothetical protein A3I25_00490 [Candidatus Nomurabacteria bacterium RIFCSPLOWO2_02_FULL_42_17]|uniref:Uncharacterized protein n=2 Tax=Candidatus Nomuraibacteriota TaxID=1752729 RepID=A0A1F6WJ76_9BACT|nr:MAG: hypothetical protein UV08_C0013G0011 [Parcubacteria group bacterium GW2011_GWA2_42_18]OGI81961.1 MAG: hypothetical protein A3B93_02335 [Candidatus Nomurabacteria bacterium RIFCSPHIGHO2_02_FULL_42_24]OGI96846.1 MAG: hypothetical protein A3I25_00490 [Candidatus Nomurabacteria bacterium RIFCSPLOWO2_02_FULL_42_17]